MTDLRKRAKGKPCMVRSPMCNHDPTTTVLAHLNGGGMGMKRDDWHAAWCCSSCHDLVDGRRGNFSSAERDLLLLWGVMRTQQALFYMRITPEMPVKRQRSSKILPRNGF